MKFQPFFTIFLGAFVAPVLSSTTATEEHRIRDLKSAHKTRKLSKSARNQTGRRLQAKSGCNNPTSLCSFGADVDLPMPSDINHFYFEIGTGGDLEVEVFLGDLDSLYVYGPFNCFDDIPGEFSCPYDLLVVEEYPYIEASFELTNTQAGTGYLLRLEQEDSTDDKVTFNQVSGDASITCAFSTCPPSEMPSWAPSDVPSSAPSDVPSSAPSDMPSAMPSLVPSGTTKSAKNKWRCERLANGADPSLLKSCKKTKAPKSQAPTVNSVPV